MPRLLEADPEQLKIVTTSCGSRVEHLDEERAKELFAELEPYGVRHDDAEVRNVTYRQSDGRFCLIDFEFSTILPGFEEPEMDQQRNAPARLHWFGLTDRGKVRPNNEDSFLCLQFDALELRYLGKIGEAASDNVDFVFAVSDGMGGAMAGEFASRVAVDKITQAASAGLQTIRRRPSHGFRGRPRRALQRDSRALMYLGSTDPDCSGMGATLSMCWFTPGWMYFGHIGDSRIYYFPEAGGRNQADQPRRYLRRLAASQRKDQRMGSPPAPGSQRIATSLGRGSPIRGSPGRRRGF